VGPNRVVYGPDVVPFGEHRENHICRRDIDRDGLGDVSPALLEELTGVGTHVGGEEFEPRGDERARHR